MKGSFYLAVGLQTGGWRPESQMQFHKLFETSHSREEKMFRLSCVMAQQRSALGPGF